MFSQHTGTTTLEWVVTASILIAVVGVVLYGVAVTIGAKLQEIKRELKSRRHDPIPEQGRWLRQVLSGHFQYYGVPTNSKALGQFREEVTRHWLRYLRRRSQRHRLTWERMRRFATLWLPRPHICHPWPLDRFLATTQR